MSRGTKLKPLKMAQFQAFLFSLLGLIAGIIYSIGGVIVDLFTIGLNWGEVALVGMPVSFAAIGFILGLVEAVLYNLFAKWFG